MNHLKTIKVEYFSDPGHGWYKVSNRVLEQMDCKLRLGGMMRGDFSYIEEDSFGYFHSECKEKGIDLKVKSRQPTDNPSRIRDYGCLDLGFLAPLNEGDRLYQLRRYKRLREDLNFQFPTEVIEYEVQEDRGNAYAIRNTSSGEIFGVKKSAVSYHMDSAQMFSDLKKKRDMVVWSAEYLSNFHTDYRLWQICLDKGRVEFSVAFPGIKIELAVAPHSKGFLVQLPHFGISWFQINEGELKNFKEDKIFEICQKFDGQQDQFKKAFKAMSEDFNEKA